MAVDVTLLCAKGAIQIDVLPGEFFNSGPDRSPTSPRMKKRDAKVTSLFS
jgi:hypothetical protein